MFRFFESLVDPYTPYGADDAPPRRPWPFVRACSNPFRQLFWFPALSLVAAAAVEAGLVASMGRVVDLLTDRTAAAVWAEHGVALAVMALFVLLVTLTDRPGAATLRIEQAAVRFSDVSHHHRPGKNGLASLDLAVAPGEKVGIVGLSGAGKPSLVKLLWRFYDVERGRIEIDGQDIADVTQESLRGTIGLVAQDGALLHRSARDNILCDRSEASEAEKIAAARRAEAHTFILGLRPDAGRTGYDARGGERSVKLSGGQRQRIALARVNLKDAPILVLGEATSALDSEASIQASLYGVMEGKTVIAIVHRLSSIAHMNHIAVIGEGRLVEEGTHAALFAQGGLYAWFWTRQSGGFIQRAETS